MFDTSARLFAAATCFGKGYARNTLSGLLGPYRALFANAGLFLLLVRRDIVARTAGTMLGGLWMLGQPALNAAAMWFLLDVVLAVRFPGQVPFLNYFLIGMLPWLMANEILQRSLHVLSEYGALFQRSIFPVKLLPLLPVVVSGTTYGIIYAVLVGMLEGPIAGAKAFVILIFLMIWLVPVCYLLSIVGLLIKDARQFIPFVLTLVMYVTPILYLPQALPIQMRDFLFLNPFADMMALIHAVVQGMPWEMGNVLRPLGLWLLLLAPSTVLFRRAEPHMREAL